VNPFTPSSAPIAGAPAAFLSGLLLLACADPPESDTTHDSSDAPVVVDRARLVPGVDLALCLRLAGDALQGEQPGCPSFLPVALRDPIERCSEFGELVPQTESWIWSLDVDRDGVPEYLMDVAENYTCDGAPGVLACGSLGCPSPLYTGRAGVWEVIGYLNVLDAPGVELLAAPSGASYGSLRGGCGGTRPCDELTYYDWDGTAYVRTAVDVRGSWVDLTPIGVRVLSRDAPLLEEPTAGAAVIDLLPAGRDVIVLGEARDRPYHYVSPCNVCASGFIQTDALEEGDIAVTQRTYAHIGRSP